MVLGHSDSGRSRHRRAVGTFPDQHAAERALEELQNAGFPMDRVSIVARGPEPRRDKGKARHVGNKSDEGAVSGAVTGGLLGTITGLLVGMGLVAIPGVGPIMLAGAVATVIATTLAGTGIGAVTGGLLGALIGLGIPEKDARDYHDRIMRGEYLVVVDGSDQDIAQVEQILHRRRIDAYNVYDAPVAGEMTGTRTLEEPFHRHSRHHHGTHEHHDGSPAVVHETPGSDHVADGLPAIRALEEPFYRRSRRSIGQQPVAAVPVPMQQSVVPQPPVPMRETSEVGLRQRAIASYTNSRDAEEAITRLRQAGFPLTAISLIARRSERREAFSGLDVRDRIDAARYGIPGNRTHAYDDRLDRGDHLVIVSGTEEEIHRAAAILATRSMTSWDVYDATTEHPTPEPSRLDTVIDQLPTKGRSHPPLPANRPAPPPPPSGMTSSPTSIPPLSPTTPTPSSTPVPPPPPPPGTSSSSAPVPPPPSAIASPSTPVPPPPTTIALSPTPERHSLQHYRAIGVFSHRRDTEAALSELKNSGFPMDRISLLARDAGQGSTVAGVDIYQSVGNKADKGAKAGATTGAALGGLGGLLVGLGALAIRGIGPIIAGGAVATAIATTLAGSAIGAAAGGIVGALVGMGIPEHRARVYNERFNRGDDLIIIDGNEADVHRAEAILKRHHIHEWGRFDASKVQTHAAAPAEVRRDGTVIDRPAIKENERLGIRDERADVRQSESPWDDPSDRTKSKNIRPKTDPEVIIVDHRNDPR